MNISLKGYKTNGDVSILNARVPHCLLSEIPQGVCSDPSGLASVNIHVRAGKIADITAVDNNIDTSMVDTIDLDGGQVWPCYVDVHTHLDKSHIGLRTVNEDGSLLGAILAEQSDQAHWSEADLYKRMNFALQCAYSHGTAAIRTHLISDEQLRDKIWSVFKKLQQQWQSKLVLQPCSLVTLDDMTGEKGVELANFVSEHQGVLGCAILGVPSESLDAQLDHVFKLAKERTLDLDFHADENDAIASKELLGIAKATLRNKFEGKVSVGHCCSLAMQNIEEFNSTMALVKESNIAIISLPITNMYLQDRTPLTTPQWRGITKVQEIASMGIDLAFASDNCCDLFNCFGDYNMHEVFKQSVFVAQLDLNLTQWPKSVTSVPASIMNLANNAMIEKGNIADLVLYRSRSFGELLARSQCDKTIMRNGRIINSTLPDYRLLD